MSNNKQQPKPENPNNQFSNTEPLTHAQRVAIANTMSNNKQIQQGWECPICGVVYSPYLNKCISCPQSITFGTSTTTSTTFLCTEFIPDGFNSPNQKCMKCGKESWQHYKITNTLHNNEQQ